MNYKEVVFYLQVMILLYKWIMRYMSWKVRCLWNVLLRHLEFWHGYNIVIMSTNKKYKSRHETIILMKEIIEI